MSRSRPSLLRRTALAITASLLVACSSSGLTAGTATDNTAVPDHTASSAAPSTEPSTTTSTTTPAPELPLLLGDGIGTHHFGDDSVEVMFSMTSALGSASSDDLDQYQLTEWGTFQTSDGEVEFVARLGRTACWGMGLCLYFAGNETDAMTFVGWRYASEFPGILSSPSGATPQASGADVVGIEVGMGGCFNNGTGSVDGIDLYLYSGDTPFSGWDSTGNWFAAQPNPEDVKVTAMEAGDRPIYLLDDC